MFGLTGLSLPAVLPAVLRRASSPYSRYDSSARLVPQPIRLGLA
jgi:hypothetical protein